jgi:hypothetical protein
MDLIRNEMLCQRCFEVVGYSVFGLRNNLGLDPDGSALKASQNRTRRRFVTTSSFYCPNQSRAVAVFRHERAGFDNDAVVSIAARRERSRSGATLGVFPTREPLALANEDFRTRRYLLRHGFPEYGTHGLLLPFPFWPEL